MRIYKRPILSKVKNATSSEQQRGRGKPGSVKVIDGAPDAARRGFLRTAVVQGASLPVAYILLGREGYAHSADGRAEPIPSAIVVRKGALRLPAAAGGDPSATMIMRDFADPYLELLRLLREAAELEHALLVQYLYAAFSLKPAYAAVAGYGNPNANDLLGVAIQEMQHLRAVNQLLVALGGTPHLERQDFPYEPDIYPFPFHLEPLSRHSLAKYVYTEAPGDALHFSAAKTKEDRVFLQELNATLGFGLRPNHLGSLYATIIDVLNELGNSPADHPLPDLAAWTTELERIKGQGEIDHFNFFKALFMGQHEGFGSVANVWRLSVDDPAYPAYPLPVNPTAYVGHERQIQNPTALALAWLGNLQYWIALTMLNCSYREGQDADDVTIARGCMLGPLWTIGRHLPKLGMGMPFDPLSMGYAPGRTERDCKTFTLHLLREADRLARSIEGELPSDYPLTMQGEMITALEGEIKRMPA